MKVGTQNNLGQTAKISKPFVQELNLGYRSNPNFSVQLKKIFY